MKKLIFICGVFKNQPFVKIGLTSTLDNPAQFDFLQLSDQDYLNYTGIFEPEVYQNQVLRFFLIMTQVSSKIIAK